MLIVGKEPQFRIEPSHGHTNAMLLRCATIRVPYGLEAGVTVKTNIQQARLPVLLFAQAANSNA
jgi:hypothetical protein